MSATCALDLPRRHLTGEWVDCTVTYGVDVVVTVQIRQHGIVESVQMVFSPSAFADFQWALDLAAAKSKTHRPGKR